MDKDRRLRFLEESRRYTPYVGVEAAGARFLVSTDDRGVDRSLFVKQGRPEFRALSRAVGLVETLIGDDAIAGRQFVDVGANIGTTTVHALVAQGFGSAVSCEPEEANFRLLRLNVLLNDLADRVRPLRVAVSNESGDAQLVVLEGRRGASWIAVDPDKIREARAVREKRIAEEPDVLSDPEARAPAQLAEMTVVGVERVTLDRLTETGVIETEGVGMLWVDAEGHEGHVLEGAGRLTDRGVPLVFEFHPDGLVERGQESMVFSVAEGCYTHYVDVRRPQGDGKRFGLQPVSELRRHADRFRDTSGRGRFSDVLLVRLDARQAEAGANLRELLLRRRGAGEPRA